MRPLAFDGSVRNESGQKQKDAAPATPLGRANVSTRILCLPIAFRSPRVASLAMLHQIMLEPSRTAQSICGNRCTNRSETSIFSHWEIVLFGMSWFGAIIKFKIWISEKLILKLARVDIRKSRFELCAPSRKVHQQATTECKDIDIACAAEFARLLFVPHHLAPFLSLISEDG
jgi:hypothetical protein